MGIIKRVSLCCIFFIVSLALISCNKNKLASPVQSNQSNQSSQQIDKLSDIIQFIRIATDLRFFHPSDAAINTDWDNFIAVNIKKIEENKTKKLPELLSEIFKNIAPTLKINNISNSPAIDYTKYTKCRMRKNEGYAETGLQPNASGPYDNQSLIMNCGDLESLYGATYNKNYHDIYIEFPTLLPVENNKTLPNSIAYTEKSIIKNDARLAERYTCLAINAKVWGVMQNFFPYFEDLKIDWTSELPKLLTSCYTEDLNEIMFTLKQSLAKLEDAHIELRKESWELNDFYLPQYTIPINFELIQDKVIAVYIDKSIQNVKQGDELLTVDDTDVHQIIEANKSHALLGPTKILQKVVSNYLIRREKNTNVNLKLKNLSGKIYTVTLLADNLYNTYTSIRSSEVYTFKKDDFTIKDVGDGIFSVNIYALKSTENFEDIYKKLNQAKGLIVDLRNYPVDYNGWMTFFGYFIDTKLKSVPLYLRTWLQPNQDSYTRTYIFQHLIPLGKRLTMPVVALSSRDSISQNEFALQHLQLLGIPIIGEITKGADGNVAMIYLLKDIQSPHELMITFTAAEVRQNDGSRFHGIGIIPNKIVEVTQKGIAENRDEILEAAVQYIKNDKDSFKN